METKSLELNAEWQQFATGSGIVTAQLTGLFARVYLGDSAPSSNAPTFRVIDGEIFGPIGEGISAWVKGSGTFTYFEAPAPE